MQTAAFSIALIPVIPSNTIASRSLSPSPSTIIKLSSSLRSVTVKASPDDNSTVDYSSVNSVFPAEACETIGGDACLADIYPEVKLEPETTNGTSKPADSEIDREYLEYDEPKTVFKGEACNTLGGEFCESEYQKGVYKNKI